MVNFDRATVERAGDRWEEFESACAPIERLRLLRRGTLKRELHGGEPAICWRLQFALQGLIYRCVMLAEGSVAGWNARNYLAGMLCARALLETIAVGVDLINQLHRLTDNGNFDEIEKLVANRSVSTRLQHLIALDPNAEATSVLTTIQKLDKAIPGLWENYEFLSEWCHPNAFGGTMLFSEIDHENDQIVLSEATSRESTILHHIAFSVVLLTWLEERLADIQALLPSLAALERRTYPANRGGDI